MRLMHVSGFGNLTFEQAVLSYEYPIVFTCLDDFGGRFLFYEIDSNETLEKWLVAFAEKDDFLRLSINEMTLGGFFRLVGRKAFVISHAFDTDSYTKESIDSLTDADYPCEGFYIGHSGPDEAFAKKLFQTRRLDHKPCLSLRLNPYSQDHGIGLEENYQIIGGVYRSLVSLGEKGTDYQMEYAPGSMVVTIYPRNPENIVPKKTVDEVFERFASMLVSEKVDEMLDLSLNNDSAIRNAKTVLKSIQRIGNGLEVYCQKTDGRIITFSTRPQNVETINKELCETEIKKDEFLDLDGDLTGYDLSKRSFSFEALDGTLYSGKLSKDFGPSDIYEVKSKQRVRLAVIEKKRPGFSDKKYTLIRIY